MTVITKKWLRQVISEMEGIRDDMPFGLDETEALTLEAMKVALAAEKLVRCKGRFHSEQNYRALAALFGVNVPDLPPLDGEQAKEVAVAEEYPEKLPCPVLLEPGLRFRKGVPTSTVLAALQTRAVHYENIMKMTPQQRRKQVDVFSAVRAMMPDERQKHEQANRGITEGPLTEGDCSSCGGKGFIDYPEGKSNVDCHACNGTGKK